jgi:sarcosine oxidase
VACSELNLPLRVERNIAHWFAPAANATLFSSQRFPIYILERDPVSPLYGFPDLGHGVKAAFHHSHNYVSPETIDRNVAAHDVQSVRDALAAWLPDANGRHLESSVCMYTLTPDEHFLIGIHPRHANVVIAGGFSGHGFKFCSVVGEALAELVTGGSTRHPLGLFDLTRA